MFVCVPPISSLLAAAALVASSLASAQAQEATSDDLAQETRLETVLKLTLARNPDMAEERARVAAARARTDQARRLPDLQLKYEQWGVPLRRPLALREANTVMLGLSQTFPPPGARAARARLADEETSSASAAEGLRRQELRAQVERAYAAYYRADREIQLHWEHVDLTVQLLELSRSSYRSGQRSQQDILRLGLELSRLHRGLAHVEQERTSAQGLLNTLMDRPVDAPLGAPAELEPQPVPMGGSGPPTQPEMTAATAALRRSEAALELARREGRWPSVTVGADYMYMPFMEDPHGYGAMVMLNLPWLSPERRDAIRAAEETRKADAYALQSVRNVLRYQFHDARARHAAARSTFDILEKDLLPQARRNFEAASANYAVGRGDAMGVIDALRSFLEVRVDRIRALAHLAEATSELVRAAAIKESRQ